MASPYKARVDRGVFLNLPGHHGGAYIRAYVEDTSERGEYFGDSKHSWDEPRVILELHDCSEEVEFTFDFRSAHDRENALHKVDTLYNVIAEFRKGLKQELALFKKRGDRKD